MPKTRYTARAVRTEGEGWTVTVAGVSAFEMRHPDPTVDMVREGLAAVLDEPADSFDVQLDFDYVGLPPGAPGSS